jgi:hypothetical protein
MRTPVPGALLFLGLALQTVSASEAEAVSAKAAEFFEKKIRPVLVAECVDCHNAEKQKGGLRLDHREAWKKGGDSGPAIVPGDVKESLLLRTIRHEEEDLKMPSKAPKLDAAVIADFEEWVRMGAPDPRDAPSGLVKGGSKWPELLEMRRTWWSLQPVRPTEVPGGENAGGKAVEAGHPVDLFLRAKQRENGLEPAGPAPASAVLRRLSYTLTGLPPQPAQALTFEKAYAADPRRAVEEAVEAFLGSERFGEHWARHWMDLMRYAETHGSETDQPLPMAWQYRDYLVRAFNQDVPLDALIREHIAGDLLPNPRISASGMNESSVGPAHFRMVEHGENAVDTREDQIRVLDNQIDVVGKAFQGMTIACARCHDHKFDAISQRDYYALQGVLASGHLGQRVIDTPQHLNQFNPQLDEALEAVRQGLAREWRSAADRIGRGIPETLEQEDGWKQAFREASKNPAHPLRAWSQLGQGNLAGQWEQLRQSVEKERTDLKEANARNFKRVWDFREGKAEGWLRSGAGLEEKPEPGRFSIFGSGDLLLDGLCPPGLITHRFSTRQHGIFVSPAFTIETGRISVRAVGFDGLVRLVPDNYAVARRFQSKAVLMESGDGWYMLDDKELPDPDRRKGQRARLEFVTREDSSVPVGLAARRVANNVKLGSEADRPRDSYFGVAEIVVHRRPNKEVPKLETSGLHLLLQKKAPATRQELAGLYAEVLRESVDAWAIHAATEDQVAFLNAFLSPGLLPVHLSKMPALGPVVEKYRELNSKVPVPRRAPGFQELESSDAPLLARGDHKSPGERVPRGYLEVLGGGAYKTVQSGRLELAAQIASRENPLTARVMANRLWYWVYGEGIVPTVDNFGRMGEKPTHPELLEYLAARLVEKGWSLKEGLRFLLATETFRTRSLPSSEAQKTDPSNRWLSHMRVRRLDAESIRDSLVQISGRLEPGKGGVPEVNYQDGNMKDRSLYLRVHRSRLSQFLGVFDAPQPFTTFGRRDATTVPAQSLTLLNGQLAGQCAQGFANRSRAGKQQPAERLEGMFLEALARKPRESEARVFLEFLERSTAELCGAGEPRNKAESDSWGHVAHALINLKEFIYIP